MNSLRKTSKIWIILLVLVIAVALFVSFKPPSKQQATKLYWFIPDGMRADPDEFTVYLWAQQGKLPNIKKMMDEGVYGYSMPVFPSHTPTNFATLLTGTYPLIHGIADGPMHIEGYPLDKPSISGFASTAKKVSPIWTIMENNSKKVVLLAIPGSTPPELKNGITIRGRWGGWGADTHAIVFEPKEKLQERKSQGRAFRLFYLGQPLTSFVDKKTAAGWTNVPLSYSPALETVMNAYGTNFYAYIFDSTDDGKINYDKVTFGLSKDQNFVTLQQGTWSNWYPVKLKFQNSTFDSQVKFEVIKLDDDGVFRIILFFNNINRLIVEPQQVADELTAGVGPMVDFPDNWPAQLVYEPEDKQALLEEINMSLDWHARATDFVFKTYKPDVFIQDTYTPNQMLESRWWHRYIDNTSKDYTPEKAEEAWKDILMMYKGLDDIIGEAMKNADENTLVVLSSDHGIAPLHRQVKLNNLFAQKGWLNFTTDPVTGEPTVNWNKTKVVFLKMAYIYINPNGLAGPWKRASGPEYEKLRNEVIEALENLTDSDGTKPLVKAVKWEDAPSVYQLPTDRIGDLVVEVKKGHQWLEEMDKSLTIFIDPLPSGYKQANDPTDKSMWTPFVMWGPGVKKGYQLSSTISNVDQMPTILHIMGIKIPDYVRGKVVTEALS